jgi:PAS domain S-box-containing protein
MPDRQLLLELLGNVDDGLFAYDRHFRFLFWNGGMERITGLSADQVLGRVAFDVFPFFKETGEDARLQAVLDGVASHSCDQRFVVPETGRRGLLEAYYRPLRDDRGVITGGAALVVEVTEARETEQRLRETEARFQNMADASPVLLWMSGRDGFCTFFNQTWLDFTGRTLAEEWGAGWSEGVHPEDFQRCMDTYLGAFGERRPFEMEYRLRRHDGEYRWILDRGVPRTGPDGFFAGYIGSCIDITERKQLELDLVQAVRVRDEFLSIASHSCARL